MADKDDANDENVVVADDPNPKDAPKDEENPTGDDPPKDEPADDEVVVTIGDPPESTEDEDKPAPDWVRNVRRENREKNRMIRERDEEIARLKGASKPDAVAVGEKPTLAACDYDEERFEKELFAWEGRKRKVEEDQRKKEDEAKQQQDAWNATLERHRKHATELKVKDYDDAEEAARGALNEVQQAIIVSGAENSALMLYALGKNDAKLKELAAIADPVKFAFAVAKLEPQLKVTQRTQKTPPLPEKQIRGSGSLSGAVDSELDRLRDEASRTGDMSKVLAYKRNKRAA